MTIPCPDTARWRDWLDGRVSSDERGAFAQHLESCPQCQQALDKLSQGSSSWSEAVRAQTMPVPPEPELARALGELKDVPADHYDWSKEPLTFLQPSDNPEHLGRLDGYEILSEVGRGGMGVVLRAYDPKLQRIVAIKVLAPFLAVSATARERFLREARAAAAVAHEHVVTIHAVEEPPGKIPYIVMQFVAGRSLQDRIDRDGPLELKEILRIGMQAASGLAAAHKQGLVHRDIKPANILLENGVERVKLADFGLARAAADASLTRSGVITGSPMFMAPEQARGEAVDHRADLFGLGCVLYAMCAGHPPFRAPTPLAVLKRVCDDTPRSLRDANPDVPDWLDAIVLKLLAKNPNDRFQSAAEVADLLGQHLRHLQQPDSVPKPAGVVTPAVASKSPPKKSSNKVLWIVLACVLVLPLLCIAVPILAAMFFLFGSIDSQPMAVDSAMPVASRASSLMMTKGGPEPDDDPFGGELRPLTGPDLVFQDDIIRNDFYFDFVKRSYASMGHVFQYELLRKKTCEELSDDERAKLEKEAKPPDILKRDEFSAARRLQKLTLVAHLKSVSKGVAVTRTIAPTIQEGKKDKDGRLPVTVNFFLNDVPLRDIDRLELKVEP